HDHQPLAGPAAGLVTQLGDPADPAVADQLRDLGGQVVRVHLVGKLGDHQAGAAAPVLVDGDHGAHGDGAAAGPVGVLDPAAAHDERSGGEVRALDPLDQRSQQVLVGDVEVLQVPLDPGRDLTQVVWRDLGGHADRDPLRPVDQQVGEPAGQHHRLGG